MKILLAVDLQKQFGGYEKCVEYIDSHRDEYDKVVATLFVNDKKANGNYIKKLGWRGCQKATTNDVVFKADQIIVKHGYGLPLGVFGQGDKIDVIGCETDACVLATCFNL